MTKVKYFQLPIIFSLILSGCKAPPSNPIDITSTPTPKALTTKTPLSTIEAMNSHLETQVFINPKEELLYGGLTREEYDKKVEYVVSIINNSNAKTRKIENVIQLIVPGTGEIELSAIDQLYIPFMQKLIKYLVSNPDLKNYGLPEFCSPQNQALFFVNRDFNDKYLDARQEITFGSIDDKGNESLLSVINLRPINSELNYEAQTKWSIAQALCIGFNKGALDTEDPACNVFAANVALASSGYTREDANNILQNFGYTSLKGLTTSEDMKYGLYDDVFSFFEGNK